MNVEEFIEHHGVKGMKWGTRRARKSRVEKSTARTRYSKPPKNLTKKELEARIQRMETEKKYNSLNRRDLSTGEKLAGEILTNSGRTVATTVLVGAGVYGAKKLIEKKNPELAKTIKRK
ncbi:MAG: hypothetical protein ABWY25_12375 [Paenisporosarcina sp.]